MRNKKIPEGTEERINNIGRNGNDGLHYYETNPTTSSHWTHDRFFIQNGDCCMGEDLGDCCMEEVEDYSCGLCASPPPKEEKEDTPDFSSILGGMLELLEYKNDKYGNAALNPLEIFGGKSGIGGRLDDKLARIKNSKELKKNDVSDCLGYLVLVCAENGWHDFTEFMD